MKDKAPSYWQEYSNVQYIKHKIISEYLKGWFPKLGSWSGKILYIDTHAGRGKYKAGQEGSPLVALNTFLKHSFRDKILSRCEVRFVFIESDEDNAKELKQQLEEIGTLPKGIKCNICTEDCFKLLDELINHLEEEKAELAPCLMFVDPYSFKIPCETLKKIKTYSASELLITFIWRELDMALNQENPSTGLADTLSSVFGSEDWIGIKEIDDFGARGEEAIQLLKRNIGAKWATYIRMLGDNQITRYFLLHLSDHEAGRDLMKEVIWKCCPDGGYYARKRDDPNQQYLITPEPDLRPLENWLISKLREKRYTWVELQELLREEIWLNKHLWYIIGKLIKEKRLSPINYEGRFSQKANPTFIIVGNDGK
ncbi:MAG: three-Cys-motif partner protein TcmP [Phycisphaerae bacterium]|jgi:three-Cys-motif partner protein